MKNKIKKVYKYIFNKNYRFYINSSLGICSRIENEEAIKRIYKGKFDKELDLNNPITYQEKIQWLKINDRKDLYSTICDKYEVKKYVANIIGKEYIVPTIGIYDSFDDIDFSSLPNQFVIKCTHDSGGVVICKDKTSFNIKKARKTIKKYQKRNFYMMWRELAYKDIKHRILVEEYIEDRKTKTTDDYKYFCFDGKVKAMFIATGRKPGEISGYFDFYDEKFSHLPIEHEYHPRSPYKIKKPENFELMIELAEKLSKGFIHVRIDFYEVNGKVYFGEYTLYHGAGLLRFYPEEWENKFGEWINLPQKTSESTTHK